MMNRQRSQLTGWFRAVFVLLGCTLTTTVQASLELGSAAFKVTISPAGVVETSAIMPALAVDVVLDQETSGILNVSINLTNTGDQPLLLDPVQVRPGTDMQPFSDPGGGYGSSIYEYLFPYVVHEGEVRHANEAEGILIDDWFGWHNRFSTEAVRFAVPVQLTNLPGNEDEVSPSVYFASLQPTGPLAPGDSRTIVVESYAGVKSIGSLEHADVGLDPIVMMNLWDWFRWLCLALWYLLELIFGLVGQWGGAIILLALVIRLFTIPITRVSLVYQQRATEQQQRIAPMIAEIKKNYSGVELSEKMIALYEDQHYDHLAPFKGMLGLFIQIPILIALFTVIGESTDLQGQAFLWFSDLSISDRLFSLGVNLPFFGQYFNLLPFLMALVTIFSTWQATNIGDGHSNALSLFGMAIVFFVFFYSFPAGLVLYWLSSNVFQLLQQTAGKYIRPADGNV
jgi:YidC/Oxa1 family membrane protein insertase